MSLGRSQRATRQLLRAAGTSLAGAIFLAASAFGQEVGGEQPKHSLRPGVWALEFEVQPKLTGYYGAAGIAVKRHLTMRSALRFGTLVAISHSDGTTARYGEATAPNLTAQDTVKYDSSTERRDVSVFLRFVRFLGVGERFGMFLEAGPTVRWISEEYGSSYIYPSRTQGSWDAGDRDSWNYGGDLIAGFEWFFTRRLSLSGRYGFSALFTDTDQTAESEYYDSTRSYWARQLSFAHSDGFNVQTTPAVISLGAYF